jgi:hypothetical protein
VNGACADGVSAGALVPIGAVVPPNAGAVDVGATVVVGGAAITAGVGARAVEAGGVTLVPPGVSPCPTDVVPAADVVPGTDVDGVLVVVPGWVGTYGNGVDGGAVTDGVDGVGGVGGGGVDTVGGVPPMPPTVVVGVAVGAVKLGAGAVVLGFTMICAAAGRAASAPAPASAAASTMRFMVVMASPRCHALG